MNKKNYLKNIINEALDEYYPKKTSSTKPKKYPKFTVKKVETDDGNGVKKELAWFTLDGLDKQDAWEIRNTLGAGNVKDVKVAPSDKYPHGYTKYVIDFPVGFAKANKWVDMMVPKITTILEASQNADYDKACLTKLAETAKEEFNNCPSQAELRNADISMENLKEEIFKAVQNGKFEDAMRIFNYTIELRARIYGHQLSPDNAAAIRAQATMAGLTPSDKGPDKYWPTFCRSEKTWKKWGRRIIDEPRMRYVVKSVAGSKWGTKTDISAGLANMGWGNADRSKLGGQILDKAGMGQGGTVIKGIMFDISDTEPIPGSIDDFAGQMGLINNLEGKLNDPALKQEEELKALDDKKQQDNAANVDAEKKKQLELVATEEGKASVFLDAIGRCATDGNFRDLKVTPTDKSKSAIDNYLDTVYDVAAKKIRTQQWSNDVDVRLMALMITAGVAYQTVGAQRIKAMHPDFSAARFQDLGQFNSTVWPIMSNIVSNINKVVGDIYKEKNIAVSDDNTQGQTPAMVKESFYNILNRMNKVNEEYNPYFEDMNEDAMCEVGTDRDGTINFLKQFGLKFGEDKMTNME